MAKYDSLHAFLKSNPGSYWRASMTEIERVIGSPLPPSAKRSNSWWSNVRNSTHVQAAAWMDAGWQTSDVTPGGNVTFRRVNSGSLTKKIASVARPEPDGSSLTGTPIPSLWRDVELEQEEDNSPTDAAPTDWFWEGNVVDAIARHLVETGWQIISQADTLSKAQGVDLAAKRASQTILIEAKGYPSKAYRDPARATETKPTSQTNQAQHWYSHALLKVMRLQAKYPEAKIAMAFPDFPRYRNLFAETAPALRKLGILVLFVFENGRVESIG